MTKQQCSGDHEQHMCHLAVYNRPLTIKELATQPNYLCLNCGRVADYERNLCNPIGFEKVREGLDFVR